MAWFTYSGISLNISQDSIWTAFYYEDRGDGTQDWVARMKAFDGNIVSLGAKADAAVTNPATAASLIAISKGILTGVNSMGGRAEDSPHTTGETGSFVLAIRRDTPTNDVSAAGDYAPLHVDALGRLRVTGTQLEDAVSADGDSGHFVLGIRRDTPTNDVSAAGDYAPLHIDSLGRLRTTDRADEDASNQRTTALAASLVVKASAGKLWGFQGYSTTTGFIQVHNTASVPADGVAPAEIVPCTAGAPFSFDGGRKGVAFGTGITIVFSSTGPTKTIGGSVMWVSCQYE